MSMTARLFASFLQQRKPGLWWSRKTCKESNECKMYATQLKDMIRMTSASEVFCEFGHPTQGEPIAFLKDIHIFLVKNEKLWGFY